MLTKRAAGAVMVALLVLGGCGGGNDGGTVSFSLFSFTPTTSNDLTGGDTVTITGSGFNAAWPIVVRFGGSASPSAQVVDATTITATSPPAPGGQPTAVFIEVTFVIDGQQTTKGIPTPFNYVGSSAPPNPTSITPTVFTATGAETFTIQGTNLGVPGGTQQVNFQGVGTVQATVSGDAQFLTGPAPVSPGAPPTSPITVSIEPLGGTPVDVPTQVSINWAPPVPLGLGFQQAGNASQPVRLANGFAVLCGAGTDTVWKTNDDVILILTGPPNPVAITPIQVGFLDPTNSIPAVMDANTFVVFSVGGDKAPTSNDDVLIHVSNAQSVTPTATPQPVGFMIAAPTTAVSATHTATLVAGQDGFPGGGDDELLVLSWSGTTATPVTPQKIIMGDADATTGGSRGWSVPYSPDGDFVYTFSVGAGGAGGDADDALVRFRISTLTTSISAAGLMLRPPIPLGGGILAGPAGSLGVPPGGVNDQLAVFNDSGVNIIRSFQALNTRVQILSRRPFAPIGTGQIALSLAGPDTGLGTGDEEIRVFTNPLTGTVTNLSMQGTHLLAPLGAGHLVVWGPGGNFTPGDADDLTNLIDDQATTTIPFVPPSMLVFNFAPLTDQNRAFVIEGGAIPGLSTGDERLVVHQSLALGVGNSQALLPLALGTQTPITGNEPFVPIGPGWGVIQSPGTNGSYGNGDDQLIIARY